MKKIIMALCVFSFGAGMAFAQLVVTAPLLETIMGNDAIQKGLYYAETIKQQVETAINSYNQVMTLYRMEERAIKNLMSVKDIKNPKEAMNWFNRQLYLEQQAEKRFTSIGVSVGGTKFTLSEIDELPAALKSAYVDPLSTTFSPEEQKRIWVEAGLSPSNYAYIQTWSEREKNLAKTIIGKSNTAAEETKAAAQRNKEIMTNVATDTGDMSEKQLGQYSLEVQVDTNNALHALSYDIAEKNELEATRQKLAERAPNPPRLSESYNSDNFDKLGEDVD
ncbi:MAG: hypothetical protein Ta2G_13470 [Termitinemataceae bacterium]|nr:MAG: hypothetical protein Ta2G_13470 [Termitinemataceae bacterium]